MSVTLLAGGDICPGDHFFSLGHGTGSRLEKGEDPFEEIACLLQRCDLRIANLEGPLSALTSRYEEGPYADAFRGPPAAAPLLRDAGWDLLHVANNHVLEHGPEAFQRTLSLLEEHGITPVGLADDRGAHPVVRTVQGLTLGFLGYSFVPERHVPAQNLYAAPTLESAALDAEALKRRVDHVVVSVHWGEEGRTLPGREVRGMGHALVAAGATLVLGHHPHVFQPVERVGNALIAYSLGDLLFDLFWDRRLVETALLRVELGENGVLDHSLVPLRLHRDYRLRVQPEPRAGRFLKELAHNERTLAREPGAQTVSSPLRLEVPRKLLYFLANLPRGATTQKLRFVLGKIVEAARRTRTRFDRKNR